MFFRSLHNGCTQLFYSILFSALQAMARLRESYSAESSPAGHIRPPVISPGPLEPAAVAGLSESAAVAGVSESAQCEAVVRTRHPSTSITLI